MKIKKWILPVCIVAGVVVLCIFARHEDFDTGIIRADGINTDITDTKPCEFTAQYIRTDGGHDDVSYPVVKVIRSADELNTYYEANKGLYSFEHMEDPTSYDRIVFTDACDKYDEDYFENRILIMVLLEEVSGSIRHKVNHINYVGNTVIINIERISPARTDDMAVWHILIEPEAGFDIPDEANINVLVENLMFWFLAGKEKKEKKIYEISDDPLMEKGDEYLIFAKKNKDDTYTVLSGYQGRFVIEDDNVFPLNSDISVTCSKMSDFLEQISDVLVKYNKNA